MDKDSKGQRKMEDSGGGLLPAVEGHRIEIELMIFSKIYRQTQRGGGGGEKFSSGKGG